MALGIDVALADMMGEPGTPLTELGARLDPPWKHYSPTGPDVGKGVGEL